MKCDECKTKGDKSNVVIMHSISNCVYYNPFYDKDGHLHHHDNNAITTNYRCTNGHFFSVKTIKECWCGWPDKLE